MIYFKIDKVDNQTSLAFYIETDQDNMEYRKIELANGGLLGFASKQVEFNGTRLDDQPLLSFEEINQLPGMAISFVNKEEFEALWKEVVGKANNDF